MYVCLCVEVCLYVYKYLATAFFCCLHHIIKVSSIILSQSAKISQKQYGRSIYVIWRLSPQWLHGNSCAWAYDERLHIAGTNKPKSAQQAKQGA